jgi:hypothetical protein
MLGIEEIVAIGTYVAAPPDLYCYVLTYVKFVRQEREDLCHQPPPGLIHILIHYSIHPLSHTLK